jgi:hypothetical protein
LAALKQNFLQRASTPISNALLGFFFPALLLWQVFACAAAVAAAEAHLQGLLPRLASAAGVSSLSYVAIQNQGSYMVELPASRTSVPQGWEKVLFHLPLIICGTNDVHSTVRVASWWSCCISFTSKLSHKGADGWQHSDHDW